MLGGAGAKNGALLGRRILTKKAGGARGSRGSRDSRKKEIPVEKLHGDFLVAILELVRPELAIPVFLTALTHAGVELVVVIDVNGVASC